MNNGVTLSTNPDRAAYKRVCEVLKANGQNPSDFIIQQSEIRMENVITTSTNYTFNLFEAASNNQQSTQSEKRLNRNDAYFVSHIALNLAKEITGTNAVPLSNTRLFSYPDAVTFNGTGEVAALEAFYNAKFTFRTTPVERIQGAPTQIFRTQPATQVSSTSGDLWGHYKNQGFFRLSSEIILDGAQDNIIDLLLNGDANIAAAANLTDQQNVLVVRLFGHLVQNGAQKVGMYLR